MSSWYKIDSFSQLFTRSRKWEVWSPDCKSFFFIAELSSARSARSGATSVRKFGNLCILEILVLRKSSVRSTSARTPLLHASGDEILHFKHTRVLALNRIASRTFRDKNNKSKADSFFPLNFNVYIDIDNREKARARDKKQRRPISLDKNMKIL